MRLTWDRIAYGSSASRDLYQSLPGVDEITYQLFEELPARMSKLCDIVPARVEGERVTFIGELTRKRCNRSPGCLAFR